MVRATLVGSAASVASLVLLTWALATSAVPGVFTTDENSYLVNVVALEQNRLTVANTDGLLPSRELLYFDPAPWNREVRSTPVASAAPPLYGPIAFPFYQAGWRGLVALNSLAFLGTGLLVFGYAERFSTRKAATLGVTAFALGGFSLEYAQGMWPHALSVLLTTSGIYSAGRVVDGGPLKFAAVAGLLLGLAAGVRYQNVIFIAAMIPCFMLWGRSRLLAIVLFCVSVAVPITASSSINLARLGSANPISKGPGYLSVPDATPTNRMTDAAVMAWARVVDFSVRPTLTSKAFEGWLKRDEATGAHVVFGVISKKALLQSAPWAALGFLAIFVVWTRGSTYPPAQRRQLRFLSVSVVSLVAAMSVAGVGRDDGLSFNQRYLLELMPLLAVMFGWMTASISVKVGSTTLAVLVGGLLATATLALPTDPSGQSLGPLRLTLLMKVPLVIAACVAISWMVAQRFPGHRFWLGILCFAALGWSASLHVLDDVVVSRALREVKLKRTNFLSATVPDRSALVAYWGTKDAAGPLSSSMDLVVLDARADEGHDAPELIRQLLERGRRVFLIEDGFPSEVRSRVVAGLKELPAAAGEFALTELVTER